MKGFSFKTTGRDIRVDLCLLAYRVGLLDQIADGELTQEEAEKQWEIAEDNIRNYRLTLDSHPIHWAVTGTDKSIIL